MYSPYHPGTYVDFATDDNGLWAVFALSLNNHTANIFPLKLERKKNLCMLFQVVMKLDTSRLEPEYMWEMSLDPSTVSDTFVACGILYGVERDRRRKALKVAFAVDLYDSRIADQVLTENKTWENQIIVEGSFSSLTSRWSTSTRG